MSICKVCVESSWQQCLTCLLIFFFKSDHFVKMALIYFRVRTLFRLSTTEKEKRQVSRWMASLSWPVWLGLSWPASTRPLFLPIVSSSLFLFLLLLLTCVTMETAIRALLSRTLVILQHHLISGKEQSVYLLVAPTLHLVSFLSHPVCIVKEWQVLAGVQHSFLFYICAVDDFL